MSYKTKRNLETVIQVIIIVAIVALLVAGISSVYSAFTDPRTARSVAELEWLEGKIVCDSTGIGVPAPSKVSLYSSDVTCTDFYVGIDFDTQYDYEVHYFAEDNTYVGFQHSKDKGLSVDEMPYLKDFSKASSCSIDCTCKCSETGCDPYNFDCDHYKAIETYVTGDDGAKIRATQIRLVITPKEAQDNIWEGFFGWINRIRYQNAITLEVSVTK